MKEIVRNFIKDNDNKIECSLGLIESLKCIGEGGNGIVYEGTLYGKNIAIKFFAESSLRKYDRFKAEYLNVGFINYKDFLVDQLNYQEIKIGGEIIPYIIMKRYKQTLKEFIKGNEPDETGLKKLMDFLITSLEYIHDNGIIHRDLKPTNILVDYSDNYVLADFGIAYYDPSFFKFKVETKKGERMGNYEFSAPEIIKKDIKPHITMDIYSMGQIVQWYVHGETHKGTGRKRISEIIDGELPNILDGVIDKSIDNNPANRFQNISEIREFIKRNKNRYREINPFDE